MSNNMKKTIIVGLSLFFINISSQVVIGNDTGTASDTTSVLIEFANTNNKGIILPYVRTMPLNPSEGTLLLDATTPSQARIKYYNGNWIDLSGQDANISSSLINQPQTAEDAGAKTIIGSDTSAADGILTLESSTKAMVLPVVDDVNNIASPSPGMVVYVNKTGAKRLAFYNGSKWSFWAP